MFNGCTLLTTAPALPAEILVAECYYEMFEDCSNLSSITMLATDISVRGCLFNWVSGVASSGTFTKAAGIDETAFEQGSSGIPAGWTVQTYGAPED